MGEDRDILVDIMLRWESFNSFSRNSVADAFLMSLFLGRLMSSVMGLADMCSGYIGFRPTLLFADFRINFSFSSCWLVVGMGLVFLGGGVWRFDWFG